MDLPDARQKILEMLKNGDKAGAHRLACSIRNHTEIDKRIAEIAKCKDFNIEPGDPYGRKYTLLNTPLFSPEDVNYANKIVHMFLRSNKEGNINRDYCAISAMQLGWLFPSKDMLSKDKIPDFDLVNAVAPNTNRGTLHTHRLKLIKSILSTYSDLFEAYPLLDVFNTDFETIKQPFIEVVKNYDEVFDPCSTSPIKSKLIFSDKIPATMVNEQEEIVRPVAQYAELFHFNCNKLEFGMNRRYPQWLEYIDSNHNEFEYSNGTAYTLVNGNRSAAFDVGNFPGQLQKLGLVIIKDKRQSGHHLIYRMMANPDKYDDIHRLLQLPGEFNKVFIDHGYSGLLKPKG